MEGTSNQGDSPPHSLETGAVALKWQNRHPSCRFRHTVALMIRAALLALEGCYVSSLGGFADVLQVANAHLRKQQGNRSAERFDWRFVAAEGRPVNCSNGLSITTEPLDAVDRFDLVFIPSLYYGGLRSFTRLLAAQRGLHPWLTRQWEQGAWLAANCTGTFVLADTGLLDGRSATTTWWLERQFRERYPRVDLQLQPVLTEGDRLLCAGASASYLLQAVKVIERFAGTAIAAQSAKTMLIDVSQTQQTPYLPLLADTSHDDALVQRAQHWLQNHLAAPLRMAELAEHLAVSERTLIRRFRQAVDTTPLTYLQHLRIDSARALLSGGDLTVQQIAHLVGYGDTSSFTRLFRERVGLSPSAYRTRFRLGGEPSK